MIGNNPYCLSSLEDSNLVSKERNVFKAGMGYTIGNYLLKGVVFLTTPIFARLMTTADYGKYSVFASYESIFFVIIGLAIHSSYKNAYYKFRDESDPNNEIGYQKYLSVTMLFLFVSLAVWLFIGFFFNKQISSALGLDQPLVYVLIFGSFVSAIMNCYSSDMGIHFKYRSIVAISFISTIASVGLSLLLINTVYKEKMYLGRIIGGFIPGLIIYLAIALKYLLQTSPKGMSGALKWGLEYSFPLVPHGISQVILTQFDRIMILRIIGDSQAGIYSFAYTIYSILAVTSSSIEGIWSPWFYEKRKANDYASIKKGSGLYVLLIFLASVVVVALCPELIKLLGGDKYTDAVYCAIPIVVGGFFACIYNVPCLVEYYHEKTSLIAISTASAAGLNIVLNAVFIPKYGYIAAAYTTLFTYIVYFLVHFFVAKRIEGKNLFPIKLMMVCALLLIICMTVSLLCTDSVSLRIIVLMLYVCITLLFGERNYNVATKHIRSRLLNK